MKQAVLKLALKAEEVLKATHISQESTAAGARLLTIENVLILHDEKIIHDAQLKEAMEEIDRIYPVK